MARVLLDAICNNQEHLALQIVETGSYGCIDSQTSRREGTALFFASCKGFLKLVMVLVDKGACVNAPNKCRATPLHAAVDNNHLEVVRLLLSRGADINARTYRGDTSLHMAAYRGFAEVTQCLVQNGAELEMNECNRTPISEAKSANHTWIAQYLKSVQRARFPDVDPSTSTSSSDAPYSSLVHLESPVSPAAACSPSPSSHVAHLDYNSHEQRVSSYPLRNKTTIRSPLSSSLTSPTYSLSSALPPEFINAQTQKAKTHTSQERPASGNHAGETTDFEGRIYLSPHLLQPKPLQLPSNNRLSLHQAPQSQSQIRPCITPNVHPVYPPQSQTTGTNVNLQPADWSRRLSTASCASLSSETSNATGSDIGSIYSLPGDAGSLCADDRKQDVFEFPECPVVSKPGLDHRRLQLKVSSRRPFSSLSSTGSSPSSIDFSSSSSSGQSDSNEWSSMSFGSFRGGSTRRRVSTQMSLESEPCLEADVLSMEGVLTPEIHVQSVDNARSPCHVKYRPEILEMSFPSDVLLSAMECRAPSNDLSSHKSMSVMSPVQSLNSMTFVNIPEDQDLC